MMFGDSAVVNDEISPVDAVAVAVDGVAVDTVAVDALSVVAVAAGVVAADQPTHLELSPWAACLVFCDDTFHIVSENEGCCLSFVNDVGFLSHCGRFCAAKELGVCIVGLCLKIPYLELQ